MIHERKITIILQRASKMSGEELLRYYSKQWADYEYSARIVNNLCGYLNRHWIKREIEEGRDNVYEIEQVFSPLKKNDFSMDFHQSSDEPSRVARRPILESQRDAHRRAARFDQSRAQRRGGRHTSHQERYRVIRFDKYKFKLFNSCI